MLSRTVIKRLRHEIEASLAQNDKRGQSKHNAKQMARAQAQCESRSYQQIAGLYSSASFRTYHRNALTALRWIADTYGCKRLEDCRPYLPAYFAEMERRGLSAWTVRTRVYALCSVYGADYKTLFGIQHLPARHRVDIMRGRTLSVTNGRFHTQEQEDVRLIARACGARRGGLLRLTPDDIIEHHGQLYIHLCEKGGKERDALVLPAYKDNVRQIFARYTQADGRTVTGGKQRLFAKAALPKDMPLHYLRAQYARELYAYFSQQGHGNGQLYHCRADRKGQSYDKGLLMLVSYNMGHSRCDVIVSHYL
ncbi:MAG: hypothetical protein HDT26_05740 [Subdoligranulum sp.]|nr:hypothetical protein [Subdoligranulum sp.]